MKFCVCVKLKNTVTAQGFNVKPGEINVVRKPHRSAVDAYVYFEENTASFFGLECWYLPTKPCNLTSQIP